VGAVPALAAANVCQSVGFAYVSGELADGATLPLYRLRYGGYANQWGSAIQLASKDGRPLPQRPHRLAHRLIPDERQPRTT
jgi:hypothetical protein